MKYLGIHFNPTEIDYSLEIAHKNQKLGYIQNKLSDNVTSNLFHGKSLFVKGVTESILSYGIFLWSRDKLHLLEQLRIQYTNRLFQGTTLIHEYLCNFQNATELFLKSRISHERLITNIICKLQEPNTPQEL